MYSTEERQPRLLVLVSECNWNIAVIILCERFRDLSVFLCVIFYALPCVKGTPRTTVDHGFLNHEAPPRLGVMFNRSAFNTVFCVLSLLVF